MQSRIGHCGFTLVGEVLTSGTLDGATVGVTQDENHLGIQGTNAKPHRTSQRGFQHGQKLETHLRDNGRSVPFWDI